MEAINNLSPENREKLFRILQSRFEENKYRHKDMHWTSIQVKLENNIPKLVSVSKMEDTGGEPDVIDYDSENNEYIFADCSAETPKGRRSICYDREAMDSRKDFKPQNSAVAMAEEMGIEMLTEDEYRELQKKGAFDQKSSSWVKTPPEIRRLGGALFCDRRYNHVFTYHNGAESYYASRGFRGKLRV